MIAGLSTLGGSYLFTAMVGLSLLDYENTHPNERCLNCDSTGSALLVPIAGPWIAMKDANGDNGGPAVCAILGLAQATGVVLSIIGVQRFMDSAPPEGAGTTVSKGLTNMHVGLAPVRGGGALGALGAAF
jgi:hypothetical protein